MRIFLLLFIFLNVLNAKIYIYSLKTKSTFSLELPTKVEKKIKLNASYGLGVNIAEHKFDLKGHIFKNNIIKINISNLKVYSVEKNREFNIKVKEYSAITEVNLDDKLIGKIKWSSLSELNNGLTQLSKKYALIKDLKK